MIRAVARVLVLVAGAALVWAFLCSQFWTGYPWVDYPVYGLAAALVIFGLAVRLPRPKPRMTADRIRAEIRRMGDEAVRAPGTRGVRVTSSPVPPGAGSADAPARPSSSPDR